MKSSFQQLGAGVSGDEDGFKLWQSLVRQTELVAQLCSIMRDVRNVRGGTQKKIEKLRQLLSGLLSELTYFEEVFPGYEVPFRLNVVNLFADSVFLPVFWHLGYSIPCACWLFSLPIIVTLDNCLLRFQPIRSPLAPGVLITGIVPSESSIFKSALHPLRLTFRTAHGGSCKIIFKKGDDLRQDQLVD